MSGKYRIHTYGCQMNVHESEKLAGILSIRGYVETDCDADADIIIFNTCCIRETAEMKILGNLGAVKNLKEQKPDLIIGVCGCMTQKSGGADKLKARCPFINIIFGTHNLHLLGEYLDKIGNQKRIVDVWEHETGIFENVPLKRTSGVNAWVNIMYGCDNFCSYCIVPYVRGRERSRDFNNILADIKALIGEGYKEITLLGQNVNSYGNDLHDGLNFTKLLDAISQIDGKFRVKFMTSHPKDLSEDVVKVIAQSNVIAHYIHLPVQAGSNRILEAMNRKYTTEQYLSKIDFIRKHIPDCGISSDIMVGFPTETEEDFQDTMSLVEKARFNNLYTFVYSRRSGTPADKMIQVDSNVKKDRITRLIDKQFDIASTIAESFVGKSFEVLVEGWKDGKATGKTSSDMAVNFYSKQNLLGQFVNVKIDKAKNSRLMGVYEGE